MKKIKFFSLILIIILCVTACGNTEKTISQKSPETVIDIFDGERRVWYIIDSDDLRYDSKVEAIFITENKKVIEGYYYIPYDDPEYFNAQIKFWTNENSSQDFCYTKFTLEDFDLLNDDEIVSKVRNNYADISKTYTLTPFIPDSGQIFSQKFKANNLPLNITYSGNRDNSGNVLVTETITLFEHDNLYTHYGYFLNSKYNYNKTISSTTIKSKNYVGISCTIDNEYGPCPKKIITLNTFDNFKELKLDSPDGATSLE